ncbi:MAG TPA: type II toxin-antitoxin system VapC family toxin [Gemmataceae bacterium]|jgi:tRNA(fMet)-specific endonuclease VapC
MAGFILDTDILSLYQHGHPKVGPAVDAHPIKSVGITVITVEEQVMGWLNAAHQAKRPDRRAWAYQGLADAITSFEQFRVVVYSEPAMLRYDHLRKMKLRVGGQDLRIAAVALEAGATVVTKNLVDFGRVPGLAVADWSA